MESLVEEISRWIKQNQVLDGSVSTDTMGSRDSTGNPIGSRVLRGTPSRVTRQSRTGYNYWSSLFADDLKLAGGLSTKKDRDKIEELLQLVFVWAENTGRTFVADKTKILSLCNRLNWKLYTGPDGLQVEYAEEAKDLGLMLDTSGSYGAQVTITRKKCLRTMHWILRCYKNRSLLFMKHMFNVYVRGILDYGVVVWYPQKRYLLCQDYTTGTG